ncbi:hypothetical protein PGTUg99_008424 [Puccinia graminis f. sp. tritici]|uniref:Uncharacterized protein n=1 Tax=Puccinia graminis f. sp. tritici TaxID=56615 RepID=A0A5B0REI2_PUCGR|nr:hypothetical protein PGTUg99_008424 [Puccinia graminis f. sp. tritici]
MKKMMVPSSPQSRIQSFQKSVRFLGEDPGDLSATTTSTRVPSLPELRIRSFCKLGYNSSETIRAVYRLATDDVGLG